MPGLPTGTVTFLFTDLEGSTRLWELHPDAMRDALARHDEILREAVEVHGGQVVKTTGDGLMAAFGVAADGARAAIAAQGALAGQRWPLPEPLRVRMGLHTGTADLRDGDYFGTAVNRTARLMSIAHGGQVLVSHVSTDLLRDGLPDGVDLRPLGEHRLRDLSRAEPVFQLVAPGLATEFPALRSLDAFPSNLPIGLSSFVGRAAEMLSVAAALGEHRMVTLTGVGGVGKTRLATQVAAEMLPRFPDGAWFCELAAAGDPDTLVETIAAAIGARPQADAAIRDTVVDFLRARTVLLVLDNCEHLLTPAGRFAADILLRCPGARILATSREGLGVDGERVIPLGSLAVPEAADLTSITASDAVQLFTVRGATVRDGFVVDDRNAAAVSEICTRLDGIPLAIELAAARLASMSAAEIAGHLDERFRLLAGGRRIAVERHQTLRSTIDWSYELLDDRVRLVFDRLGVFVGSFDALAAVGVTEDRTIDRWDVLDALGDLVTKSMLVAEASPDGATRYQQLETLRQYARERLDEGGTTDAFRRRHAEHYAAWAETAGPGLLGPEELAWRSALNANLDNLRVAVAWSFDSIRTEDRDMGMRIVAALSYEAGANRRSGIFRWADRALAFVGDAEPGLRTAVMGAAAWSAVMALDYERARELADAAAGAEWSTVAPGAGARGWTAMDAASITAALYTERFDEAETRIAQVAERWADASDQGNWILVMAASTRACSSILQGNSDAARRQATDALEIAHRAGSPSGLALAYYVHGWVMMYEDPDAALASFTESLRLSKSGASDMTLAHVLARAACVRAASGDPRALDDVRDALVFAYETGSLVTAMSVYDYAIRALVALGYAEIGAVVHGFVETSRAMTLNPVAGVEADARDAAVARLRHDLGAATFDTLSTRGAQMSHDELAQWLLNELTSTFLIASPPGA